MKLLLFMGLAFGAIVGFANQPPIAGVRKATVVTPTPNGLNLSIVAPKRRWRRTQQLKLLVMLVNSGKEELYVFGAMEWGYSASLLFHIRDASGKDIEPVGLPDDQTLVSLDYKNSFVKLHPNQFLGINFFAPLDVLNLNKPGKYAIFVEYHSPISTAHVELKPFFGKENGAIRSNVVHIEVVR